MTGISKNRLGSLVKIAGGGQGTVYKSGKTVLTIPGMWQQTAMVYKEYKPETLRDLDTEALKGIAGLLPALSFSDGMKLITAAAWPCELVDDAGGICGFLMPEVRPEFFIAIKTGTTTENKPAGFEFLLNEERYLQSIGIKCSDKQRYALLLEVAKTLEFFGKKKIVVGDFSPKNVLFSLNPRPSVFFIDCDGMRLDGKNVLKQVETPGWQAPKQSDGSREELATPATDAYKFGLLVLGLLSGSQDSKSPQSLPASVPGALKHLLVQSLSLDPARRPLPSAWISSLEMAKQSASGVIPQVHARPSNNGRALLPPSQPSSPQFVPQGGPSSPQFVQGQQRATRPAPASNSLAIGCLVLLAVLIAIAIAIAIVVFIDSSSDDESLGLRPSNPNVTTARLSPTTGWSPIASPTSSQFYFSQIRDTSSGS